MNNTINNESFAVDLPRREMTLKENIRKITSEIEAWAIERDAHDKVKDIQFYIRSEEFEYEDYNYRGEKYMRKHIGGFYARCRESLYAPEYTYNRQAIKWKNLSTAIKNYYKALENYPTSKPVIDWC